MGLYVEVMCDARKDGRDPSSILVARCWSNRNDNPEGRTIGAARRLARQQGWKIGPGAAAICPGCLAAVPETGR